MANEEVIGDGPEIWVLSLFFFLLLFGFFRFFFVVSFGIFRFLFVCFCVGSPRAFSCSLTVVPATASPLNPASSRLLQVALSKWKFEGLANLYDFDFVCLEPFWVNLCEGFGVFNLFPIDYDEIACPAAPCMLSIT